MNKNTIWGIYCVWHRYFRVFRKSLFYGIITTFLEPILFLLSFGVGLGQLVGNIHTGGLELSYRQFIFSGILAQTIMFQAFFEAAYGSFVRMYYQKIFQAIGTTPITISEILWGEILWDSSKASFAATVVLIIGCITGDFNIWGALCFLPACFLFAMLFSSLGLLVSAKSGSIEEISYPQYLLIFPMFLFCGVFFPLENLPEIVQKIAWLLPLTSVVSLSRFALLGLPFNILSLCVSVFWLLLLVNWSRKAMTERLIK